MRVTRKDEVMMRQMFVPLIQPEIEYYAGARWLIVSLMFKLLCGRSADEFTVGSHRVFIRDHSVEVMDLAQRRHEPSYLTAGSSSVPRDVR